jgi:hypothetical protein
MRNKILQRAELVRVHGNITSSQCNQAANGLLKEILMSIDTFRSIKCIHNNETLSVRSHTIHDTYTESYFYRRKKC